MVEAQKGRAAVTRGSLITAVSNYAPLVRNFARRELKSRYKRSLLGWTWSMLSPLSTILVYSLVFSVFFRAAPPAAGNGSQNFALFLFTGLVVWLFFAGMINGSIITFLNPGNLDPYDYDVTVVDHKDSKPWNYRLNNLRFVTRSENSKGARARSKKEKV